MTIYRRILSWEDFVPEEDFVLCIFSPLLLTFSCGNDYILEDFVPGGFCPRKILPSTYAIWWIYGILEYFFPREDFVPEEDFVLSIFSPLLLTFTCGNDCIWEDFVMGGFCPVPMQLNAWWFFFPQEDFVPEEDFVLIILSPLLLTFSCCNDWILKDYVPGGFYPREDFVLYLCNSMVSLIIYGILEGFFPGRILSQRRILSSSYSLHYYLHSVVVMIEFWRILSRGILS